MIKFIVYHVACVVVVIYIAKHTLAGRRDIPRRIKWRHYAFLSFLIFMNLSGLSQASWTFGRLLRGDLISQLEPHFIALRELPRPLAEVVWAYCVIGPSIIALLVPCIARSSNGCRTLFVRLFPLLVIANCISSCIDVRGADGLISAYSAATDYLAALLLWCVLAWPYVFVYRFYRGSSSDSLFLSA